MSLILDGTNGLSDVDGSASTPAIRGTDANTGIFFPAADTIAFAEGGVEQMRIDSSGNVGIGTTTPTGRNGSNKILEISSSNEPELKLTVSSGSQNTFLSFAPSASAGDAWISNVSAGSSIIFANGGYTTQRMRLNSDGALLINRTSQLNSERLAITGNSGSQCMALISPTTAAYDMCNINNGNGQVGVIQTSGSSTSYNTTSDYRLKENVAPMTGALATVAQLKPVTYKWKVDGSNGQGFIAHELQAVVPDCVNGEKDAVETYTDEDGNEQTKPKYQGVDTSFLVATLTAAIQELKAIVDAQAIEIAELKAGN